MTAEDVLHSWTISRLRNVSVFSRKMSSVGYPVTKPVKYMVWIDYTMSAWIIFWLTSDLKLIVVSCLNFISRLTFAVCCPSQLHSPSRGASDTLTRTGHPPSARSHAPPSPACRSQSWRNASTNRNTWRPQSGRLSRRRLRWRTLKSKLGSKIDVQNGGKLHSILCNGFYSWTGIL